MSEIQTVFVPLNVSEEQQANLVKLADYLLKNNLEKGFTMGSFGNLCGSPGCAIGHGPYAGIPIGRTESWTSYGRRAFYGYDFSGANYAFLFDSDWVLYDNTPQGAANRIIFALKHGIPEMKEDEQERFGYIERVQKILKEYGNLDS